MLLLEKSKYLLNKLCYQVKFSVHLCKSFEYGTLIFKNCAVCEVTIEKYVGWHVGRHLYKGSSLWESCAILTILSKKKLSSESLC